MIKLLDQEQESQCSPQVKIILIGLSSMKFGSQV